MMPGARWSVGWGVSGRARSVAYRILRSVSQADVTNGFATSGHFGAFNASSVKASILLNSNPSREGRNISVWWVAAPP